MVESTARLDAQEADDGGAPAVPLCVSCWAPQAPHTNFCASCGAPVGLMATVGPLETIWAWAWALGAAGRWGWTRSVTLVAAWAVAAREIWFITLPREGGLFSDSWPWMKLLLLALLLAWMSVLALVVRYVTLRWWRKWNSPDPVAPDEIQPDPE